MSNAGVSVFTSFKERRFYESHDTEQECFKNKSLKRVNYETASPCWSEPSTRRTLVKTSNAHAHVIAVNLSININVPLSMLFAAVPLAAVLC